MRSYEVTTIIKEGQAVVEETKNAIKDIFKKYTVELVSEEDLGQKKLWHKIDTHEYGFFTFFKFNAQPDIIAKIEHEFKLNQNIIRSMIVKA